jgi:hypothetical protein
MKELLPAQMNGATLVLGGAWVFGFLVVAPWLAKSYGPGKALAIVATPILIGAIVLGMVEGQKRIDEMNNEYRMKQEQPEEPKQAP